MRSLVAIAALAGVAHAQPDLEQERELQVLESSDVDVDEPITLRWEPKLVGVVRAGAGAVDGDTINPGGGALSLVDGHATGSLVRGRLQLDAPLLVRHRQTFGASLSESRVRAGARATYRFTPRVRVSGELAVGSTWKPDWPDPFQRGASGELGATDRYSHWDRLAMLEVVVRPARHQRVRVRYDYALSVYEQDPMFDAIYDPLHLTPWDRETHRLDAVWRMRRGPWKLRAGGELMQRQYFFMFAGDARTGVTHAGPGGEPPNPLLELRSAKPRVEFDIELHPSVLLRARYELELVQDTFEGYLSYVGHHPTVDVTWALPRDSELTARAEIFVRRYGANSYFYEDDPMRPPLAWGDRRAERLGIFELAGRTPITPQLSVVAEAELAARRTNYAYSIDWNYTNWLAWAGVEYRYR